MKQRHHSPEQIVRKLAEADKLLAQGKSIEEVARHLEISEATFHRWRNQYGGRRPTTPRSSASCARRTSASRRSWPTRPSTSTC